MRCAGLLLALLTMLSLGGCGLFKGTVRESRQSRPAHGQKGDIRSLSFEEFFLLHQDGRLLLLDARHAWFYHQGRIPGAVNLPTKEGLDEAIEAMLPALRAAIDEGRILVVYCNGFGCHDARTLSRAIAAKGLDVSIFSGGWKAWKKAELPVESTSQADSDLSPQPSS